VTLKQIAAEIAISESCSTNWLKAADVEVGSSLAPGRLRMPSCAQEIGLAELLPSARCLEAHLVLVL
jgi:hypothetical protein